jgi:hypothetical protein
VNALDICITAEQCNAESCIESSTAICGDSTSQCSVCQRVLLADQQLLALHSNNVAVETAAALADALSSSSHFNTAH